MIPLFSRAVFGTDERRAFGRVPLVMLLAFVVSVVAEAASPVISPVGIVAEAVNGEVPLPFT